MKSKITLTKSEQRLQVLFIISILSSFVVMIYGMYLHNHNIYKHHILIPLILLFWTIPISIYAYNGLTNGNLVKKWTPTEIYHIMLWIVTKITSNKQKAKSYTYKTIAVLMLNCYLLVFFKIIQIFISIELNK